MMKLSDMGFDQWFQAHVNDLRQEGRDIARISAVDRGSYLIRNETREVPAELAGKFYFQVESSVDLPCVGDWVTVQYHNNDTAAIIHEVFPRKTFLRRKSAGEKVDFQMIAANIDVAFIVQSCHFDFNVRRMDRYLVMAADGGVEPIVVLTKTDLITPEELEQKLAAIRSSTIAARVLALSNITGIGFDEFQQVLVSGRTYCLLGSSGVGKTTLINHLIGRDDLDTKAVSGTGEQDAAKATVEGARADLERAKSTLQTFAAGGREGGQGTMHVSSPVDGAVFRIYRESEGAVGMGDPLMDVGNAKNLEVRVEVLSADAVKIRKGTPVLFKRWGGEGTLTGVVRIVEPAGFTKVSSLGVEEQRVLVIADITAPQERWRSLGDGYRLEANFVIWEGKDVLQIPAGALFRSGKEWAVFAAENGKARLRRVEVGQRNGLTAEILSGLKEKEQVIAHPDDAVSDGAQIRPRK